MPTLHRAVFVCLKMVGVSDIFLRDLSLQDSVFTDCPTRELSATRCPLCEDVCVSGLSHIQDVLYTKCP